MASKEIEKKRIRAKRNLKLNRARAHLDPIPTILIVCEGENTEPSYFDQFKLQSTPGKGLMRRGTTSPAWTIMPRSAGRLRPSAV